MNHTALRFRDFVLSTKAVTEEQLKIALTEQKSRPQKKLGALLCEKGFLGDEDLLNILSKFTGIPAFSSIAQIQHDLLAQFGRDFCDNYKCLVFQKDALGLHVALLDPEDLVAKDKLEAVTGSKIIPYHITSKLLQATLEKLFNTSSMDHQDAATATLFDNILSQAIRERASDIHFRPMASFLDVCLRIDGILSSHRQLHLNEWQRLLIRIKVLGGLDIAETRKPQHGRFPFQFAGRTIDLRVATHPTVHGENIVLRILDKKSELLTLEQLGFNVETLNKLRLLKNKSQGMIIFTGPTGSGKTTSLYALLCEMDRKTRNIMTLEQPIEYIIDGVRQTEVTSNLTYGQGIRSLLRQDPDVLLIGEIRDEETAKMALRASMTGHLVISTLHTQDAYGVPGRLRDLGLAQDLLADNLIAVIAQRLVRKVCFHCAQTDLGNKKQSPCAQCKDTGFYGRICVSECMIIDDILAELLAKSATALQLKKVCKERLWNDALAKVEAGQTTYDEICRAVGEPVG